MADNHSRDSQAPDQEAPEADAVPFFSRFLEDQKRIRTGVKAGRGAVTMKYPSDNDDDGPCL